MHSVTVGLKKYWFQTVLVIIPDSSLNLAIGCNRIRLYSCIHAVQLNHSPRSQPLLAAGLFY